jgi:hypothetical protein
MKYEGKTGIVELVEANYGEIYWYVTCSSDLFCPDFKEYTHFAEAIAAFNTEVKKFKIVEIIDTFTTEMEGYNYYGSNPGVPVDSYEEVAAEIIKHLSK